jgi:hypothetical protein
VEVAWSRYRLSYEYRANEGGSGEPIGVLAFVDSVAEMSQERCATGGNLPRPRDDARVMHVAGQYSPG